MDFYMDQERFRSDKRPWHGQLHEHSKGEFNFAVVGDRTGFALKGVFEDALEVVKRLKPDFVLSVGDLIEGYWSDENEAHQEWNGIDSNIRELGLPFFRTVGNHDCGNETMLRVWRDRYGPDYYAFRYENALFLILNTEDPPIPIPGHYIPVLRELEALAKQEPAEAEERIQAFFAGISEKEDEPESSDRGSCIGDEQFDFIRKVLEEHVDVDHTFILMHRPLWKTGDPGYEQLTGLLEDRRYTIFGGHLHKLEVTGEPGGFHIQLGRTGAIKHKQGLDDFHHILWVSVRKGIPGFSVIKLDGSREELGGTV